LAFAQPPAGHTQKSSKRVQRLEDSLVDQIAAGEVVERPASVVKELVENALDAHASSVRVEVRDGGASLIAVTDDGHGMPRGDIRLALQRHATSKISSSDDLMRIGSFGFRGEALPAIASVSRLRVVSREPDSDEGWEIQAEAGKIIGERASGAAVGTRVEVADLFGAVPARRKFLKKPATEWGHIKDWLGRLALTLPGVHFELRHDDRPTLVWPATADPLARIAAVLSEQATAVLVPAAFEAPEGHVEAYVSGPEHTRTNGSGLYLFVNGRPVRDPVLRYAVLDAYRDVLPRGRFPTAVVFLTVPPESVDVNVHPAKWEVRFSEPRSVQRLIRHCIRTAMEERRWLEAPEQTSRASFAPAGIREAGQGEHPARHALGPGRAGTSDWVFAKQPELGAASVLADSDAPAAAAVEPRLSFGSLRVVGQLLASYLVVEGKQGLILVDQHAAHERVLYERLRGEWLAAGVASQALLLPETVEIEPLALAALVEARERVARLGFDIESFGEEAILVRSIPALLSGRNPAVLVRELARELQDPDLAADDQQSDTRLLQAADRIFATLACHSARRFGDHLEPEEQHAILRGLDQIPWAPTCPHGRPVAVSLDVAEIERRFGRR
jgi:DNA mismatch repair protein MutL